MKALFIHRLDETVALASNHQSTSAKWMTSVGRPSRPNEGFEELKRLKNYPPGMIEFPTKRASNTKILILKGVLFEAASKRELSGSFVPGSKRRPAHCGPEAKNRR